MEKCSKCFFWRQNRFGHFGQNFLKLTIFAKNCQHAGLSHFLEIRSLEFGNISHEALSLESKHWRFRFFWKRVQIFFENQWFLVSPSSVDGSLESPFFVCSSIRGFLGNCSINCSEIWNAVRTRKYKKNFLSRFLKNALIPC